MNKKSLTIILCLVLLVSFFLPYLGGFSGFDMVFGKYKIVGSSGIASGLIPIGAILLLFGALTDNNFTTQGFVYWMPLVGIAFIIVMIFAKVSGSVGMGELIGQFGYGLWLTVVAAILLLFTKN